MGITVEELVTRLAVDDNRATSTLRRFNSLVGKATVRLGAMGAAFTAAGVAIFRFTDEQTRQLDVTAKMARTTGASSREFQRLGFVAERSGASMRSLTKASQNLSRNIREAALAAGRGKKTGFTVALEEAGLSLENLASMSLEGRIGAIADALKNLESSSEGAGIALSRKLLGERSGPELASMLALGRDGIRELGDELERYGGVISKEGLDASEEFQDSLTNIKTAADALKKQIAADTAPAIGDLVDEVKEFVLANKDLIRQKANEFIDKVTLAAKGSMSQFLELGTAIGDLIVIFIDFISGLSSLIEKLGGLDNAFRAAAIGLSVYLGAQAAAINPILGMAVAVGGVSAAFIDIETSSERAARAMEMFNRTPGGKALTKRGKSALAERLIEQAKQGSFSESTIGKLAKIRRDDLLDVHDEIARELDTTLGPALRAVGLEDVIHSDKVKERAVLFSRISSLLNNANRRRFALMEEQRRKEEAAEKDRKEKEERQRKERESRAKAMLSRLGSIGASSKGKMDGVVSDEELFKLVSKAAETGQPLTGLIGDRRIEGGTPPVIAVRMQQTRVEQTIDIANNFEGIEGESVEMLAERVNEQVDERFERHVKKAIEDIKPVFAR